MPRLLALALAALTAAGCNSYIPDCGDEGCGLAPVRVLMLNGGDSTDGSFGRYDPVTGTVDSTALAGGATQGLADGSDGFLYVTLPEAGRVDIFDEATLRRTGTVPVPGARHVAFGPNERMYVTSRTAAGASDVVMVDRDTRAVLGSVPVGGAANGIVVSGTRLYVATGADGVSHEVVVLDTRTDAVVDRVDVGCAPRFVLTNGRGNEPVDVFAVCTGTERDEVVALSGLTGRIAGRFDVGGAVSTAGPGRMAVVDYAPGGETLFVARADGAVVRFPLRPDVPPVVTPLGGDPIVAVAHDPVTDELYVARVRGRGRRGYVTVHNVAGAELRRFPSGGPSPVALRVPPPYVL